MMDDWECLRRASTGDETAWRWLTQRHSARLYRLTVLITRSPASAEDVVRETFLRALNYAGTSQHGSFTSLLSTIAYRLALKEKKRDTRHQALDADEIVSEQSSPLDEVLKSEKDRAVASALAALDPIHRDVMVLRFYGEHSYEEIAEIADIPLGTVKSRLYHAVARCRDLLKAEGYFE